MLEDDNSIETSNELWKSVSSSSSTYKDLVTNLFEGFPSLNFQKKSSGVYNDLPSGEEDLNRSNASTLTGASVAEALRDHILTCPNQIIHSSEMPKFYANNKESEALIKVYGGLKKFVQSYSNFLYYELDGKNPKRGNLHIRAVRPLSTTAPPQLNTSASPFKYSFQVPSSNSIGSNNSHTNIQQYLFGSSSFDSTIDTNTSGRSTLYSNSNTSSSRDNNDRSMQFHLL